MCFPAIIICRNDIWNRVNMIQQNFLLHRSYKKEFDKLCIICYNVKFIHFCVCIVVLRLVMQFFGYCIKCRIGFSYLRALSFCRAVARWSPSFFSINAIRNHALPWSGTNTGQARNPIQSQFKNIIEKKFSCMKFGIHKKRKRKRSMTTQRIPPSQLHHQTDPILNNAWLFMVLM